MADFNVNDKILIPNFTIGEPNMNSARRKNSEGLCAMHLCNNKLGNPPAVGFMGMFYICDECRKPIDEMLKEEEVESYKSIAEMLTQMLKIHNGESNA